MAATPGSLYNSAILSLAIELAQFPLTDHFALTGAARSRTCGSSLELGLDVSGDLVMAVGLRTTSCAIGQASAAIMAAAIVGRGTAAVTECASAVAGWLDGVSPMPDWPRLSLLGPARDFPARHGAIMLPWNAACSALSKSPAAG